MNIPNNSISEEIKEIVEIYNELKDEEEFYFNPPASENEIKSWEIEKGITIPEQYKDWLMFSNGSRILGLVAEFYELDRIVTEPVLENKGI